MAHSIITSAAVAGRSNRNRPALSISFSPESQHSRRLSTASSDSDDPSPLTALDSSAALILVHDSDDSPHSFDFSDEDEDRDGAEELVSPMFQVRSTAACPPLPPSTVFLYLLAPLLKLGALNIQGSQLPLKYGLPALFLSALASLFARQIWYMLARYLRKADLTEVVVNTFARGRGKERQRALLRTLVKLGSSTISILVAVTYLRVAIFTLYPYSPQIISPTITYVILTLVVGIFVACLSYARSLGSKRVIYSTSLSLAVYLVWWSVTLYAHSHQSLYTPSSWLGFASMWQGLATTTFAFCSSSTLPLYASLKSTTYPTESGKTPRSRSFRILSIASIFLATLLHLPSVLFAAFPTNPETSSLSLLSQERPNLHFVNETTPRELPALLNATIPPVLAPVSSLPAVRLPSPKVGLPPLSSTLAFTSALILLLGIPSVIVTTPPLAIPGIRSNRINISRILVLILVLALSLVPPRQFPTVDKPISYLASSPFFGVFTTVLVFLTLASTYFFPAFIHIAVHWFKKPLTIVVPPRTPLMHTPSASQDAEAGSTRQHASPRSIHDELLLRKERALQRRQLKKRIIWDLGSWVLAIGSILVLISITTGFVGLW